MRRGTLGDGRSLLVFPGSDGAPLPEKALRRLLQNQQIAAVPHGFRSTFRDWAAEETNHPREVIEAALAHMVQESGRGGRTRDRTCSSAGGGSWTTGPRRSASTQCPAAATAGRTRRHDSRWRAVASINAEPCRPTGSDRVHEPTVNLWRESCYTRCAARPSPAGRNARSRTPSSEMSPRPAATVMGIASSRQVVHNTTLPGSVPHPLPSTYPSSSTGT